MREDIKVKDFMTSPAVSVPLGTPLDQVAALMLEKRIGSVLVVDEKGKLVGIVTESDFLKERGIPFSTFRAPLLLGRFLNGGQLERILQEARATRVEEIMTAPVHAVGPEAPLRQALEVMLAYDINRVPVVDEEGKPLGVLARFDLLKALASSA
ncbi:CBS domain-containing protein [Thermus arciformis]|uniref:CBS domain-containing protein n=1 Tax=Thermus arciformis TaxID=482827 RepID=A0A1G7F7P4_9DEIN|nr:CBS domain-containing protein [Thermus arciformis]SDE71595.1 CBS domain-containing protein [Thermus arciformis]